MKRQILLLTASILTTMCFGQTDTIFSNNEKIVCKVKEITPDAVKYEFPGEDLIVHNHGILLSIKFVRGARIVAQNPVFREHFLVILVSNINY